jgi:glycosyltransferase involved in cell wall biosynthesis
MYTNSVGRSFTVIIPTLNEERNIEDVIYELKSKGFSNILVIDGNSTDETVKIVERLGVVVIHQNGKGKGQALRQAFGDERINGNGVIIMDADGSMNPNEIFSLVKALECGADVVKGSRFVPGGHSEDMTMFRRIGNGLFVWMTNLLCSTNYTDLCYGFAAFRGNAIERLYPHLQSQNFEIETEIFIKAKKLGLKVVECPSVELRRRNGKSNLRAYKDGFRILRVIFHEFYRRMD